MATYMSESEVVDIERNSETGEKSENYEFSVSTQNRYEGMKNDGWRKVRNKQDTKRKQFIVRTALIDSQQMINLPKCTNQSIYLMKFCQKYKNNRHCAHQT